MLLAQGSLVCYSAWILTISTFASLPVWGFRTDLVRWRLTVLLCIYTTCYGRLADVDANPSRSQCRT